MILLVPAGSSTPARLTCLLSPLLRGPQGIGEASWGPEMIHDPETGAGRWGWGGRHLEPGSGPALGRARKETQLASPSWGLSSFCHLAFIWPQFPRKFASGHCSWSQLNQEYSPLVCVQPPPVFGPGDEHPGRCGGQGGQGTVKL